MNEEFLVSNQRILDQLESLKQITSTNSEPESMIKNLDLIPKKSSTSQFFQSGRSSKTFEILQKPFTSLSELKIQIKSFKPFSKLCQMLEFHEEKRFKVSESLDKSFSISSSFHESFPSVNQSFSYFPSNPSMNLYESLLKQDSLRGKPSSKSSLKQSSLLELREKAKQKEVFMLKRKKSAVLIQACFRGFRQRQKFRILWQKHLRKAKFQRLREIARRIKVLFAPYVVLNALKKWLRIRRREKAKIMQMFRRYSATFIQKCWKGFKTRKKFSVYLKNRKNARDKIKSLIIGWKTRKVLKCSKMLHLKKGIIDLLNLIQELESTSSEVLYNQMIYQIPAMKQKFLNEFRSLYNSSSYLKINKPPSNLSSVHSFSPSKDFSPPKTRHCRDEEPVKSCQIDPILENDSSQLLEVKKPEKVFKNFLKRGQNKRYNPKPRQNPSKSPLKAARPEIVPQISLPPNPESIPTIPTVPYEFDDEDIYEPAEDSEENRKNNENTGKIYENNGKNNENDGKNLESLEKNRVSSGKNFLKRKSKTYEPQKIEWKGKSRVKCWTANDDEPKVKKNCRSSKKGFERLNELEFVFQELSKKHVGASEFFMKRLWEKTKVPQVLPGSRFVEEFSDDGYEDYFELLQSHYLQLCNEELLT